MVSVMSAPEKSVPKSSAITVTSGISALRSAWFSTTRCCGRPLAQAVRM